MRIRLSNYGSLCVLSLTVSRAYGQQQLQINQVLQLNASSPLSYSIPTSSTPLTISVALCNEPSPDNPRFFVTNNSAVIAPGPSTLTDDDVFEVLIAPNGVGTVVISKADNGGVFAITAGTVLTSFEVGLSNSDPLHALLPVLPLLGDTTSNQALLFSPPFLPPVIDDPTYPNYTLPSANLSSPSPPSTQRSPNFTLILGPTANFPSFDVVSNTNVGGLPVTACALRGIQNLVVGPGTSTPNSTVLRDEQGWRTQWLVGGVQPQTNYTAYVIQDSTKVVGPITLVTKSASFSCPLVHSLPFCPLTSYAVPLPPPPDTQSTYDATNLPASISGPLLGSISNLTTTLTTFACGRDWYSPLKSCADCQRAYRTWVCAVSLPRCGEARTAPQVNTGTGDSQQQVLQSSSPPALQPRSASTPVRNPAIASPEGGWTELLPCLETCNAADRACPAFLGFACPLPRFNAKDSYGVGYVDGDKGQEGGAWVQGGGDVGVSQDRWGNVWCNG